MNNIINVNATTENKELTNLVLGPNDPVPSEVQGDVFDRQRVMKGFNQSKVEDQVVFVLGVGGIGSSVAMGLVRLGVKKIILLDKDTVDATNLNRQMLFHNDDVGRPKVEAAKDRLLNSHNLRTEIEIMHMDAVTNWGKVVTAAQQCTAVFNNIDYGSCFDLATTALCKKKSIPYIAGSTYANTMELVLFTGKKNDACYRCADNISDCFDYSVKDIEKFKENSNTLSIKEVESFMENIMHMTGPVVKSIVTEIITESKASEVSYSDFCSVFLKQVQNKVENLIKPSSIESYVDINFIAKGKPFPTRTVGSWISVCCGGSMMLINLWIQALMKTDNDTPVHNWTKIDIGLFEGGFNSFGFHVAQEKDCAICNDTY